MKIGELKKKYSKNNLQNTCRLFFFAYLCSVNIRIGVKSSKSSFFNNIIREGVHVQ